MVQKREPYTRFCIMARTKGILEKVSERSDSFAIAFVVFFFITFGFLTLVGATPNRSGAVDSQIAETPAVSGAADTASPVFTPTPTAAPASQTVHTAPTNPAAVPSPGGIEAPVKVVIKKIGLNVSISNPDSTDVEVLDQNLLHGAVRYPSSALLGVDGTMLLFGHSSYLPIVHNQAYKAFDGIQNLQNGDIISVYSGTTEYQYSVTSERVADATSDVIELPQNGRHLTLVTCDSFATKSNRFVVTGDLVGSYTI